MPPDTTHWQQRDALLEQALDLPPEERTAFLDAADLSPDLRQQLDRLLALEDRLAPDFLAEPAQALALPLLAAGDDPAPLTGQQIGPYQLLREIGRGGMGLVYLATRNDGHFQQQVALKLVHHSRATEDIFQRFRHERQILASLQHPNIARLLDGGVTEDGLPYLVMEYIDGLPITAYGDAHRLGIDARLKLFVQVCEAVQYAHQNLVIHRDLKPSNILVTATGEVKLLDFGVAKLLDAEAKTDLTVPVTMPGGQLLTPAYASPEQLKGEPVTTATDVYALGVVLYELLTGERPHQLETRMPHEAVRVVLETEAQRPSVAIQRTQTQAADKAAIFAARETTRARLRQQLMGDLDVMTLKALTKEPARRYATAAALGTDVERYLIGLPVMAQAPTARYRLRKFVLRHRLGVGAAVVLLLSILVFSASLVVARQEAERSARQAEAEARKAEAVTAYTLSLFDAVDPNTTQGQTLTVRNLLDIGAQRIGKDLQQQPAVRFQMLTTLGQMYLKLGLVPAADTLLQQALDLDEVLSANAIEATLALGQIRRLQSRFSEAAALHRRAVAESRASFAEQVHPTVALALAEYAATQRASGQYPEAVATAREAYDYIHRLPASADTLQRAEQEAQVALVLGEALYTWSQYDEALAVLEPATQALEDRVIGPSLEKAALLMAWGHALQATDQFADARARYQEALAMTSQLVQPSHTLRAALLYELAQLAEQQGDPEAAYALLTEARTIYEEQVGTETSQAAQLYQSLAQLNYERGDTGIAQAQMDTALAITQRLFGASIRMGNALKARAAMAFQGGRRAEAQRNLRAAIELFEQVALPIGSANLINAWAHLGDSYAEQEDWSEAAKTYARAVEAIAAVTPLDHPTHAVYARYRHGLAQLRLGRAQLAISLLEAARAEAVGANLLPQHSAVLYHLGAAYQQVGRHAEQLAVLTHLSELPPPDTTAHYLVP